MTDEAMIAVPELICHSLDAEPLRLVPAAAGRDWMDRSEARWAYRCLPLSIANSSGWDLLCPFAFSAYWTGGPEPSDVVVAGDVDPDRLGRLVESHFGLGVLTFHVGWLFRTSPGWALWVRGAPNHAKSRIAPLDGVVETDWLPFTFSINWRFTRPGFVRFEADEPIGFITLVQHAILDAVQPVLRPLEADADLSSAYAAWSMRRTRYDEARAAGDAAIAEEDRQPHYARGTTPNGGTAGFHVTKRSLRAPRPG